MQKYHNLTSNQNIKNNTNPYQVYASYKKSKISIGTEYEKISLNTLQCYINKNVYIKSKQNI